MHWQHLRKLPQRWGGHELHIEVAMAAKKHYPHEAIQIFTREAERFIGTVIVVINHKRSMPT